MAKKALEIDNTVATIDTDTEIDAENDSLADLTKIDLGDYDDAYKGWHVIIDPDLSLEASELAMMMADKKLPIEKKMPIMKEWIEASVIWWDFRRRSAGGWQPLPQPREGGAKKCSMKMLPALARAVSESVNIPNE